MSKRELELLLINRSGPVRRMKFRPWWIYLLVITMLVMGGALAAGGYLFFKQEKRVRALSDQTAQLRKSNSSLTTQLHDLKTMAVLAKASDSPQKTTTPTTGAQEAPTTTTEAAATTTQTTTTTERRTQDDTQGAIGKDLVGIRIVKKVVTSSRITVFFDVVNKSGSEEPVSGYVTTIARGNRAGKPWIESSPPMRLSPLGRPLNYRRGEAFSVQRYRRFRAHFTVADKTIQRLEFLLYSRTGDLLELEVLSVVDDKDSGRQESDREDRG